MEEDKGKRNQTRQFDEEDLRAGNVLLDLLKIEREAMWLIHSSPFPGKRRGVLAPTLKGGEWSLFARPGGRHF